MLNKKLLKIYKEFIIEMEKFLVKVDPNTMESIGTIPEPFIMYSDGACKNNPGPSGAGIVIKNNEGVLLKEISENLGIATNNVAEYRAVIIGLQAALNMGIKHIRCYVDSKLVCEQVNGNWKVKNKNIHKYWTLLNLLKIKFEMFSINHVRRHLNTHADKLANDGVRIRSSPSTT